MASLIVPSRFACLKIEDDDEDIQTRRLNKKPAATANSKTEQYNKKSSNNNKNDQYKKNNNKHNNNNNGKKKNTSNNPNPEQWTKWQERDFQLVDNYFEKDLEQALLLSKLDFESQNKKNPNPVKVLNKGNNASTSKKTKTFSLHDFNEMVDKNNASTSEIVPPPDKESTSKKSSNFFGEIDNEAKKILRKEQYKTIAKIKPLEPPMNTSIKQKFIETAPEQKTAVVDIDHGDVDAESTSSNEDFSKLKQDYDRLQKKYKKLCGILREGEMKDKTVLLIEIERLTKTQTELTSEITSLYAQLEQEKSKSSHHHEPKTAKDKNLIKKSVKFNDSSEIIPVLKTY